MAKQTIGIGTTADDGTGDTARAAGTKINANFTELYTGAHVVTATDKATPVNADVMALQDSASSNALKKVTWANIKATLKAYFDTLYSTFSGAYGDLTGKPTLGTAAALDVGTTALKVVQLDADGKLPAVDGSLLTGIAGGGSGQALPVWTSGGSGAGQFSLTVGSPTYLAISYEAKNGDLDWSYLFNNSLINGFVSITDASGNTGVFRVASATDYSSYATLLLYEEGTPATTPPTGDCSFNFTPSDTSAKGVATGSSTITVSNPLIGTGDAAVCTLMTADATAVLGACEVVAGTLTINFAVAPTSTVNVGYRVFRP